MGSPPRSSVANDPHDAPFASPAAANSPEATETEQPAVISYARQLSWEFNSANTLRSDVRNSDIFLPA